MRNLLVLVLLFCACGQGPEREPDLEGGWVVSFDIGDFSGVAAGIHTGALTLTGPNHGLTGALMVACGDPCPLDGEFGMAAFGWDGWSGLFEAHIPVTYGSGGSFTVGGEFGSDAFAGDIHTTGTGAGGVLRLGSMYAYRE